MNQSLGNLSKYSINDCILSRNISLYSIISFFQMFLVLLLVRTIILPKSYFKFYTHRTVYSFNRYYRAQAGYKITSYQGCNKLQNVDRKGAEYKFWIKQLMKVCQFHF